MVLYHPLPTDLVSSRCYDLLGREWLHLASTLIYQMIKFTVFSGRVFGPAWISLYASSSESAIFHGRHEEREAQDSRMTTQEDSVMDIVAGDPPSKITETSGRDLPLSKTVFLSDAHSSQARTGLSNYHDSKTVYEV